MFAELVLVATNH